MKNQTIFTFWFEVATKFAKLGYFMGAIPLNDALQWKLVDWDFSRRKEGGCFENIRVYLSRWFTQTRKFDNFGVLSFWFDESSTLLDLRVAFYNINCNWDNDWINVTENCQDIQAWTSIKIITVFTGWLNLSIKVPMEEPASNTLLWQDNLDFKNCRLNIDGTAIAGSFEENFFWLSMLIISERSIC